MIYNAAASAIHQILGAVIGMGACILIGSACVVDAVNKVAALLKPNKPEKKAPNLAEYGLDETGNLISNRPPERAACPFCGQDIKPEAVICKHCGRELSPMRSA